MAKANHFETKAIRNQVDRTQYGEHSVPMFLTSSFTFSSGEDMAATFAGEQKGLIYSRYANPNTNELIQKMCALEGTEAGFAFASGMAAVFSSMAAFLHSGDHVIASRAVFGSTHQILTNILSRWDITHTYVEPTQVERWEEALQPNTKMLICETPSNPGLVLVDLEKAGQFAKQHNLIFNVDNCFATPYIQNPAKYGANLVVHSATKFIDGQGRTLGGIVVGNQTDIDTVIAFARHTGPALSPFNAWLLSKSLETLAVRMDRHCENAKQLATYLEKHPAVNKVLYPHLPTHPQYDLAKNQMKLGGGLVSFELKGGRAAAFQLTNNIKMCSLSANLGDTRTIVTHPASTTHSKLSEVERQAVGISQGLMRVSVGLEHIEDIIGDLEEALKYCGTTTTPILNMD